MANERRVSQLPVEVLVLPDDALARTSQLPVEFVVLPDGAEARISQVAVEVVIGPGPKVLSMAPLMGRGAA